MYTNKKRRNSWTWVLVTVITLVVSVHGQNGVAGGLPTASVSVLDSTKDQDGLVGSVRRVKVQSAKLELKSGQVLEGPLRLLEITTYDLSGNRIDNASYPVAQSSVGKEQYKYDDRGNLIEMTLHANDGSILSRENYEYEIDNFGNWRKMVTSLVVYESGELKHEPIEVTYREIAYYFDDSVAKIVKRGSPQMTLPAASPKFPELTNALDPGISTISSPPLSIELGEEPPEIPNPAKPQTITLARPSAESTSDMKGISAASLPAGNDSSAGATRGPVANLKEDVAGLATAQKDAVAYYEKGRAYFDSGAFKEAVDSYHRSIELEPRSAEVYLSLGHAYLKLKNMQEAAKAFKQATTLSPEMAEAHYGLGLHYLGVGQHRTAADAFKRATQLRPNMSKAHYGLAIAYRALGRTNDVIAELRILETLDRGLARKLYDSLQNINLPCGGARSCK